MDDRILITFFTTTQAMRMEDCCRRAGENGRLIPVPGKISAGCGLGWMTEKRCRERLISFMTAQKLEWQGIYELEGILKGQAKKNGD